MEQTCCKTPLAYVPFPLWQRPFDFTFSLGERDPPLLEECSKSGFGGRTVRYLTHPTCTNHTFAALALFTVTFGGPAME